MKSANELLYAACPCGSGKKFKFCCYPEVRDELPCDATQEDVMIAVRRHMQPFGMINDIDPVEDREAIGLVREGISLRDKGGLDEAIAKFRESRSLKPKLYAAWNNEAVCLWCIGEFDRAIGTLKEGLSFSADVNSFGWGQLAVWLHLMDDDAGAEECAGKAAAIMPLSADAAAQTCQALALLRRHGELLAYAEKSGFDETPWISYYIGVAALNLGDIAKARLSLASPGLLGSLDVPVDRYLDMLEAGVKAPRTPSGDLPYWNLELHPSAAIAAFAAAGALPRAENAICDCIETMLAEHSIAKKDALAALGQCRGRRALDLKRLVEESKDFDTVSDDYIEFEDSPDENVFRQILAAAGNERHILDLSLEPPVNIDDAADKAAFVDAMRDSRTAKPGSRRWKKAKEVFKSVGEKHPGCYRAIFNYATMLEREGEKKLSAAILEKVAGEHPEYCFAQAALVCLKLSNKDVEGARKIVFGWNPPLRLNPQEYLAWLRAKRTFFDLTDDLERAYSVNDAICRIADEFGLPMN